MSVELLWIAAAPFVAIAATMSIYAYFRWFIQPGDQIDQSINSPGLPPACDPLFDEKREADLFLGSPLSWWLDPNRWGDDPNWRERLLTPKSKNPMTQMAMHYMEQIADAERAMFLGIRACLVCKKNDQAEVIANHGDEANLWRCNRCDIDYTRKRITRRMKRRPAALSAAEMAPPAMPGSNGPRLPCGHYGEIVEGRAPYTGWPFCVCVECGAEWEPPSNGTSREMAQGEKLFKPSHKLWEKHVERIHAGTAKNHGACPTCDSPVAKRDGMYYCSRKGCRRESEGWR